MEDNVFKIAREESGLSFRDLTIKLKEKTGKDVNRKYIHKLITSPGRCKNGALMVKLGVLVGLDEKVALEEWQKLRKQHLEDLLIMKVKRGIQ